MSVLPSFPEAGALVQVHLKTLGGGGAIFSEPVFSNIGNNIEIEQTCVFRGALQSITTYDQIKPMGEFTPGTYKITWKLACTNESPPPFDFQPAAIVESLTFIVRPGPAFPVPAIDRVGMLIFMLCAGTASVCYLKRRKGRA